MSDHPRAAGSSRLVSWVIGGVLVGWVVVYNIMRIGGSSPADAVWPSLGIGALAGLAVAGALALARRRLAAAGRVVHRGSVETPSPRELGPDQRAALHAASWALGALAVVALVMGGYLAADWLLAEPGDRATTTIVLAAWNIVAGLWFGDEAMRLRRDEADGSESLVLGCALTAVLAGVGLSRDLAETGQVVLIVAAGAAGMAAGVAVWRLMGSRGVPLGAVASAVVAGLSVALPLAL